MGKYTVNRVLRNPASCHETSECTDQPAHLRPRTVWFIAHCNERIVKTDREDLDQKTLMRRQIWLFIICIRHKRGFPLWRSTFDPQREKKFLNAICEQRIVDKPTLPRLLIRIFSVYSNYLQHPLILLGGRNALILQAGNEGPDQSAHAQTDLGFRRPHMHFLMLSLI